VNEVLGEVRIDNVNIFGVDVLNVRRAISTISQDSLLFCGTVRQNLDPAEEYPDHVLTKIIDTVDLTEKVSQLGGLDGQIEARGANFSKGEKQLLCLGRSLLSKAKIVLIDEATSSIDLDTETKIHKIIQENFQDVTVLAIQHRLSNYQNFDNIMVVDKGSIIEFGTPERLIEAKGAFYELLNEHQK